LFVCLFSPDDISKSDAASIAKLAIEILHHESGKRIYFGIKRSKVKVTRHKTTLPAWIRALLWVLASSGFVKCFYPAMFQLREMYANMTAG